MAPTPTEPGQTAETYMRQALGHARPGLGRVWPNPSVGCVIVADGEIVGVARTGDGGRPHAEVAALGAAGARARGATVYVTLEPCHHFGRSPPCTRALRAAGVARVVVAVEDPDPRVNGAGLAALRAAGIEVDLGLLAADARELNAGFFSRIVDGRPLVIPVGRGPRSGFDAALLSLSGVTDHVPAHEHEATIVLDPDLELLERLPAIAGSAGTFVITRKGSHAARGGQGPLELPSGVEVVELSGPTTAIDLVAALRELGARGLTRIAVSEREPIVTRLSALGLLALR